MYLKSHLPDEYMRKLIAAEGRITLHTVDERRLYSYKKGYEGEQNFFELTKHFDELVSLRDISLENNGLAQYDFLFISENRIYHFDIKNFTGNYQYVNGNIVSQKGYIFKDLLSQLERAHYKLQDIINKNHLSYKVESRILFINEDFILHNFKEDKRALYHNDLPHIIHHLSTLKSNSTDLQFGRWLLKNECRVDDIHPTFQYDYSKMITGIKCNNCGVIGSHYESGMNTLTCICGESIKKHTAIKNAVEELKLLKNSDGKVRVKEICEWTGVHKSSVKRYLSKYHSKIGSYRNAEYI